VNAEGWHPPSTASGKSSGNETLQQPDFDSGVLLARGLIARQRAALDAAAPQPTYSEKLLADIELQFAWGIFTEIVGRGRPGKATAHDSVVLHMMHFLVAEQGLTPVEAREKAMALERLYDEAEPLFQTIAARGRLAYLGDSRQHFIELVRALPNETT
jgi:hypothetical protein